MLGRAGVASPGIVGRARVGEGLGEGDSSSGRGLSARVIVAAERWPLYQASKPSRVRRAAVRAEGMPLVRESTMAQASLPSSTNGSESVNAARSFSMTWLKTRRARVSAAGAGSRSLSCWERSAGAQERQKLHDARSGERAGPVAVSASNQRTSNTSFPRTGSQKRPDSISSPISASAWTARPSSPRLNLTPCSCAPPKSEIVTTCSGPITVATVRTTPTSTTRH